MSLVPPPPGREAPARHIPDPYLVLLRGTTVQGSRALLLNRMQHRAGHFMKAGMLDSQLSTLEEPHETEEVNVSVVKLGSGPDEATERGKEAVIQEAVEKINRKLGP